MIRKTVLIGLILICTTKIFSQNASDPADLGVAAIGLVVSDIEASEKFYTEILGMIQTGSFSLDEEWSEEAGMSEGRPFSVKMFRSVDGPSATILKLAYFDHVPKQSLPTSAATKSGVNYLTFHYNDLDPILERIEKANIDIIGKVKRSYELVIIQDPDGVFIELVQPKAD